MRLFVISDPHFAGPAEVQRKGWERRAIRNPALRQASILYRSLLWLADPTAHNHQLDAFLDRAREADLVVANGDFSCDSGFVGLCDDAAFASAELCLAKLRGAFGNRLLETMGDHELGKMSLFGGVGGPRIASWHRCTQGLGIPALWKRDVGAYTLLGVTSSLLALPMFSSELLPEERLEWDAIRTGYLDELGRLVASIPSRQRVILFCHDPSALPFLAQEPAAAGLLPRLDLTIVGHLHSPMILGLSRVLAGMPVLTRFGQTARRLSSALGKAREWAPFRVALCPSPSGIQLLKDGGYLEIRLDPVPSDPPRPIRHRLPWR